MKTITALIKRSIEIYDLGDDYAPIKEFTLRAEQSSDQVVWEIKELLIKLSNEKNNCWGVLLLDMICLKASNQDSWEEPIAHLLPVLKRMGTDKQIEQALKEFTAENIPNFKNIESFEWNRVGGMYWTPHYWWGYLKEYETPKIKTIFWDLMNDIYGDWWEDIYPQYAEDFKEHLLEYVKNYKDTTVLLDESRYPEWYIEAFRNKGIIIEETEKQKIARLSPAKSGLNRKDYIKAYLAAIDGAEDMIGAVSAINLYALPPDSDAKLKGYILQRIESPTSPVGNKLIAATTGNEVYRLIGGIFEKGKWRNFEIEEKNAKKDLLTLVDSLKAANPKLDTFDLVDLTDCTSVLELVDEWYALVYGDQSIPSKILALDAYLMDASIYMDDDLQAEIIDWYKQEVLEPVNMNDFFSNAGTSFYDVIKGAALALKLTGDINSSQHKDLWRKATTEYWTIGKLPKAFTRNQALSAVARYISNVAEAIEIGNIMPIIDKMTSKTSTLSDEGEVSVFESALINCDFDEIFSKAEEYKELILTNIEDIASNFRADNEFIPTSDSPAWLVDALKNADAWIDGVEMEIGGDDLAIIKEHFLNKEGSVEFAALFADYIYCQEMNEGILEKISAVYAQDDCLASLEFKVTEGQYVDFVNEKFLRRISENPHTDISSIHFDFRILSFLDWDTKPFEFIQRMVEFVNKFPQYPHLSQRLAIFVTDYSEDGIGNATYLALKEPVWSCVKDHFTRSMVDSTYIDHDYDDYTIDVARWSDTLPLQLSPDKSDIEALFDQSSVIDRFKELGYFILTRKQKKTSEPLIELIAKKYNRDDTWKDTINSVIHLYMFNACFTSASLDILRNFYPQALREYEQSVEIDVYLAILRQFCIEKVLDEWKNDIGVMLKSVKCIYRDLGLNFNENLEKFVRRLPKYHDVAQSFFDREQIIESLIVAQDGQPTLEISLSGKRVCVTGKLSLKRKEIEQLLEANGAVIASGVSKTTDILIAGEDAGSKLSKANELGIMVLTEEEAKKLIGL